MLTQVKYLQEFTFYVFQRINKVFKTNKVRYSLTFKSAALHLTL